MEIARVKYRLYTILEFKTLTWKTFSDSIFKAIKFCTYSSYEK